MAQIKSFKVQHDNMLCLFSGGNLELPYRFQPDLCFIVTFDEYKSFVEGLINCNLECLSFELKHYKEAIDEYNNALLKKYYFYDLSKAVLNEVCLAASKQAEGTVIVHNFDSPTRVISSDDVAGEIMKLPKDNIQKALKSLQSNMSVGLNINSLSKHNLFLWRYALYLRAVCYSPSIEEIKLEDY